MSRTNGCIFHSFDQLPPFRMAMLQEVPVLPNMPGEDRDAEKIDDGKRDITPETKPEPFPTIPNRYRWTAFAMIIFFATGSSFAEAVLSPLKSTLLKELKINSACVAKLC